MKTHTHVVGAADAFLEELAAGGASPKTVEARRLGLIRFLRHCDQEGVHRVRDITLSFLEAYRGTLCRTDLADATVEQYLRGPRLLLAQLAERGVIFENPARHLAIRRQVGRLPRVPSEAQVRRLLAQPSTHTPLGRRDRALMELLYSTGARVSEAVGVSVDDLDLDAGTVRLFGKGRRERLCPVGAACARALRLYLCDARARLLKGEDSAALWIGIRGEALKIQNVEVRMRTYSSAAGIKPAIAPHGLRRAMATHMLHHGADPITLQTILGHASLQHLSQYLRLTIGDIRRMHRRSRLGE